MLAVAEEAQRRFRAEIDMALHRAGGRSAGAVSLLRPRLSALATRNPAHFEIISSGRLIDHDSVAGLSRDNAELMDMTGRTLADALAQGQLRPVDLKQVRLAAARWFTALRG